MTVRAAVLGVDVSKSRSPAIHSAAFRALGIEGEYAAISVEARRFRAVVGELRLAGYRYLNVTIPHKKKAAALADRRGPEVRVSGAANTLLFARPQSPVRAENTDGAGLIAALGDLGVEVSGKAIVIAGAGGAAAGALEALTRAGAQVRLLARRPAAARSLRRRLPESQGRRVTVIDCSGPALALALEGPDVLVSAIPDLGWAQPDARAGLESLARGAAVLEMAYGAPTPLYEAVRSRTRRYADGLGMLVHQAARAIELALGKKPPLPPLFRAARRSG